MSKLSFANTNLEKEKIKNIISSGTRTANVGLNKIQFRACGK